MSNLLYKYLEFEMFKGWYYRYATTESKSLGLNPTEFAVLEFIYSI